MQNKNTQKIIIDKVKLKTLQRLNCPEEAIIQKILYNNFIPQGDELIDLLLESLTDEKVFSNWGGNRENSGRKPSNNNNINQDEKIKLNKSSCNNQLVDKDKDKDKDIDKDKDMEKDIKEYFNIFWEEFKPVKCNGRFVDKGSKKTAYEKFIKLMKKGESYEDIIRGTREYISHCQANNQLTCGATVFLNQERWKNDYETTINGNTTGQHEQPCSILETYTEIAREYQ